MRGRGVGGIESLRGIQSFSTPVKGFYVVMCVRYFAENL
jgi:hypothetical protein